MELEILAWLLCGVSIIFGIVVFCRNFRLKRTICFLQDANSKLQMQDKALSFFFKEMRQEHLELYLADFKKKIGDYEVDCPSSERLPILKSLAREIQYEIEKKQKLKDENRACGMMYIEE